MIKEVQDRIGRKEFTAMIIIALGAKISDMTPTIIFQETKNAGWMVPIMMGLLMGGLFALLLHVISKHPGKGLFEITNTVLGKKIGFIFTFGLFLIAVVALIIDSRSHIDTIGTMYFPETPNIIIYFVFMLTSYFVARRGLHAIGIVSWLVLPYLIATIVFMVFLVFKDLQFIRVFPILGPGIDVVAKESVLKVSTFSDVIFFAFFIPLLKKDERFSVGATIGLVYAIVQLTVFFSVYVALFDMVGVQRIMYPFHETARFLSIGEYFTNTETFFMAMWLVGVMVKFSFYLFITCFIFAKLFSIKQIRPLLLPFASLAIFVGSIPENPVETVFMLRENLLHVTSFYLLFYILVIWTVSVIKGR